MVVYFLTISERLLVVLEICNVKGLILVVPCSLSDYKDENKDKQKCSFRLRKNFPRVRLKSITIWSTAGTPYGNFGTPYILFSEAQKI